MQPTLEVAKEIIYAAESYNRWFPGYGSNNASAARLSAAFVHTAEGMLMMACIVYGRKTVLEILDAAAVFPPSVIAAY